MVSDQTDVWHQLAILVGIPQHKSKVNMLHLIVKYLNTELDWMYVDIEFHVLILSNHCSLYRSGKNSTPHGLDNKCYWTWFLFNVYCSFKCYSETMIIFYFFFDVRHVVFDKLPMETNCGILKETDFIHLFFLPHRKI